MMGDKLHRREANNPDHQPRPLFLFLFLFLFAGNLSVLAYILS